MMPPVMTVTLTLSGIVRARLVLLALAATVVAAACGSAASPSPSAGAVSSPGASAAASSGASPSPTPDYHAAPALEARLPDSIGGVAMQKISMNGADFLAAGSATGQTDLQTMLQQLGKTTADLFVAETWDPTATSQSQAAIFQVKGADPTKLLSLWVAGQVAATGKKTRVTNVTIAGQRVTRLEDFSADPSRVSYAWSSGDSIVIVGTKDESVVTQVLAAIKPA